MTLLPKISPFTVAELFLLCGCDGGAGGVSIG